MRTARTHSQSAASTRFEDDRGGAVRQAEWTEWQGASLYPDASAPCNFCGVHPGIFARLAYNARRDLHHPGSRPMIVRNLGSGGLTVSAVGLGCMGMSEFYEPGQMDDSESVRVIHRYLDAGGNLLDT